MKIRNSNFWNTYFTSIFIPQVDIFKESLLSKLLPAFSNLEQEAETVAEREYDKLGSVSVCDFDGDMSEMAEEAEKKPKG